MPANHTGALRTDPAAFTSAFIDAETQGFELLEA